MSRILLTWELGDHLGHLARYIPIARELSKRGKELLFAIKAGIGYSNLVETEGFHTVQAPAYFDNEIASRELLNYADILAANGFNDAERLSGLMDSWSSIFKEFRPDIVVTQFAPSSLLSAHLNHIPAMRIDCGFGCPPDETPYPCFRPWLNVAREELLAKEQLLLNRINKICVERGAEEFALLQDVFKTDADLLLTAPELDHYTGRRHGNYVGPIFNLYDGENIEWQENNAPCIFVYLRPFEGLPAVCKTLSACDCNTIAILPGISEEFISVFSSPNLKISGAPARLTNLLPKTDIAITHGGHGLASACLLFGVPMLLIPQMAEQLMTVYNYERLGIGKGVKHDEVAIKFETALKRMLKDSSYRENAGRLSLKYSGYDQAEVIQMICNAIEEKAGERL